MTHHTICLRFYCHPWRFPKSYWPCFRTKLSVETWNQLWRMTDSGPGMHKSGVTIRDRQFVISLYNSFFQGISEPPLAFSRYMLWCMEKFRAGIPIQEFVHKPLSKETIRGYVSAQMVVFLVLIRRWGPCAQNGKWIRLQRLKNK